MPTYLYRCPKCKTEEDIIHKMLESPDILCNKCAEKMNKCITSNSSGFILKGDGWVGKNIKNKNLMMKKRREVGSKMVKNHDTLQISPNYKGEICKDWTEAKKLAQKDGVDTLKYDKQVEVVQKRQHDLKIKKEKILKNET